MLPRSSGNSPASLRSSVLFPAPFGPSTATVSPSVAEIRRSRSSVPSRKPTSASSVTQSSEPAVPERDQDDDRDRQQHEAERDRDSLLALEEQVHREGNGLGA